MPGKLAFEEFCPGVTLSFRTIQPQTLLHSFSLSTWMHLNCVSSHDNGLNTLVKSWELKDSKK